MQNPLVTIVIPTFNRVTYLEEAISSVANQTYKNIEILVIDDGSNVNYAEKICNKFKNCTYHYKKNGGLSSARNYGINKSNGEYIAFLDDDDFWKFDKLEKQVEILIKMPTISCVHSSAFVVDINSNLTGEIIGASKDKLHKRSGYVFWNALTCWVVKSPTPLIRKTVFQPDLMFDENIKVGEDIDFYQRMFFRHKVYYIDESLAYYREYDNQERLSLQTEKYIGIESKMIQNFKKMNINNPIILHLISIKLAKKAVGNWNLLPNKNKIEISKFTLYFRPENYLNKFH